MRSIVAAQGTDLATFILGMTVGLPIAVEGNPVIVVLYGAGGIAAVAGVKIMFTGIALVVISRLTVLRRLGTLVAFAAGCLGTAANLFTIWRLA